MGGPATPRAARRSAQRRASQQRSADPAIPWNSAAPSHVGHVIALDQIARKLDLLRGDIHSMGAMSDDSRSYINVELGKMDQFIDKLRAKLQEPSPEAKRGATAAVARRRRKSTVRADVENSPH